MAKNTTRDLILSVAATLFATAGFRRTTMETIAPAAGRGDPGRLLWGKI